MWAITPALIIRLLASLAAYPLLLLVRWVEGSACEGINRGLTQ